MDMLKRFISDERGLETIEYALILALIAIATVGVIKILATAVQSKFTAASTVLNAP